MTGSRTATGKDPGKRSPAGAPGGSANRTETDPPRELEPPLASVATSRREILVALKRAGSLTTSEVAAELGVSLPACRQQLGRLEADGLVTHSVLRSAGRGRPTNAYRLTGSGEALFPKRYGDLTTELLGYLGGPESDEVGRLFEQRGARRLHDAERRLEGLDLAARVGELARILDEDGYLADVEELPDGGWRIVEHNCAILSVAHGFRQACTSELGFIRAALPGARVERVAHLMDGNHVCAYEVRAAGC